MIEIQPSSGRDENSKKIMGMLENGQFVRRKTEPVTIKILSEDMTVEKSGGYYNDGAKVTQTYKAGTILADGYELLKEDFEKNYEPAKDDNGQVIPDRYVKVELVKAIQNPFNDEIEEFNGNGYSVGKYDKDCIFVEDKFSRDSFKFKAYEKEFFEKLYEPYGAANTQGVKHIEGLEEGEERTR